MAEAEVVMVEKTYVLKLNEQEAQAVLELTGSAVGATPLAEAAGRVREALRKHLSYRHPDPIAGAHIKFSDTAT